MTVQSCGCKTSCCQSNEDYPDFVKSIEETPVGKIPIVSTDWNWREQKGAWKARWGINRMNYRVDPGLYGVGSPNADSPVFVSANYKLSFDKLRKELTNIDAWILVLDTKGINVWCAAGKGTFGTDELIIRINEHELSKLVNHNQIIIPQLGAPGIAAYEVTKQTKFKVIYGPIMAKDIPEFLSNHMQTTDEMREVKFPFYERLILTPMELVPSLKYFSIIALIVTILHLLTNHAMSLNLIIEIIPYFAGLFLGSVFVPAFLPWIPFRSFALKGALAGFVFILIWQYAIDPPIFTRISQLLVVPGLSSYLAVNFTGSTTFTSLSGVQKELSWGIPLYILAAVAGIVFSTIQVYV